ncbi:MAG: helix-turn-helix transcriptional regulator [Clostridia bacterium]|nr:helix-turn-helix transcriptional regulator [Clostridia bacterium]
MEFHVNKFEQVLNVTGIANLHYFEFTPQYQTIEDHHNFFELVYVDKGAITVDAENYSGMLSDNQLLIHRPNEVHSLTCLEGVAPNVIIIGFECDSTALNIFSSAPVTLKPSQKKMLADLLKEGMSVYAPPYNMPYTKRMHKRDVIPFGADQLLKIKLEMFLILLLRGASRVDSPAAEAAPETGGIAGVHRYVCEHYNQKITLEQLCLLFGTNKTTLCDEFRVAYGDTIFNYINHLRVKEAKALMREGKYLITDISARVGFSSIHYFCRVFKRIVGQPPKDYMNSIKANLDM